MPKHDWTAKSKEARRLFKELDALDDRDEDIAAHRKSLKRRARAAQVESAFILEGWMTSGQFREMHK